MKLIIKKYGILFFLFLEISFSYSQVWKWEKPLGGTGEDVFLYVTLNKNKNYIYAIGLFQNTITIGTTTLTSAGDEDALLVKYDTSGNVIWVKNLGGGTGYDSGTSLCEDDSSNLYVTAIYSGTAIFGNDTLTGSTLGYNTILAKYDSSGTLIWLKKSGGASGTCFNGDVVIDKIGNLVVSGAFSDTAIIGGSTVISHGGNDAFIAKYTPSGNIIWLKTGGGISDDVVEEVAIDANNNIFATGWFALTATFDSHTLTTSGSSTIFLAQYSPSGNVIWIKQAGGSYSAYPIAISIDLANNYYVDGYFSGTAHFDTTTIISAGHEDIFIAKYDDKGNRKWTRKMGGTGFDGADGIAIDNQSNIYISGYFTSAGTPLGHPLGQDDIFVAKYDSTGNFKWSISAGEPLTEIGMSLTVDNSKNIYVVGGFAGTCHFDNDSIISKGSYDTYLAKIKDTSATNISTGIIEIAQQISLNVYPNPFQENITLNLDGTANQSLKISVVNVLGQELITTKTKTNDIGHSQTQIALPNINSGIYFIQIRNETTLLKSKILIKN